MISFFIIAILGVVTKNSAAGSRRETARKNKKSAAFWPYDEHSSIGGTATGRLL
jgi:hypothetical protein